jgi:hypothetical protein
MAFNNLIQNAMKTPLQFLFIFLILFTGASLANAQCPLSTAVMGNAAPCETSRQVYKIYFDNTSSPTYNWTIGGGGTVLASRQRVFGKETLAYILVQWPVVTGGSAVPGDVTITFSGGACAKSLSVQIQDCY